MYSTCIQNLATLALDMIGAHQSFRENGTFAINDLGVDPGLSYGVDCVILSLG